MTFKAHSSDASVRHRWIRWLLVAVATAGCDNPNETVFATEHGVDPRFEPLVQAMDEEMADDSIPGAAIAIVEGGELSFAYGFGIKHPDSHELVAPSTIFRVASLNKTFTAVALLQLVEQDLVDLNSPIGAYLPDLNLVADPTAAERITVRQLLTHSSAIVDHGQLDAPEQLKDDDALADYLADEFNDVGYLLAPPGRMFNYSNSNYVLLGRIIETVSGQYYRQYLQEHLFDPLEMYRTFFLPADVIADGDYAWGRTYHWETAEPVVVGPESYDNGWARPAGYAFSSVLDLAKFLSFLHHGNDDVLGAELWGAMQQPQVNTEFLLDTYYYGYGLFVRDGFFITDLSSDFYSLRLLRHDGAINGYSAMLHYVPGLEFGMVTLANTDSSYFLDAFAAALESLCALGEPSQPPDLSVTPQSYERQVGTYFDPHEMGPIQVVYDHEQLTVSVAGLDAAEISYDPAPIPFAPNNYRFYVGGYPTILTFILDPQGQQADYFRTRGYVGVRSVRKPVLLPQFDQLAH